MLGSVVLDVAIGMIFVYLLLSLIASSILEIIAALVQTRSANLQRGIRSMFSEDSIEAGITLAESIYKHGLTRGLYQDPLRDYNLATGVIDKFRHRLQKWFQIAPPKEIEGIGNPLLLPAYIPSRTFALALIDLLVKQNPNGQNKMERIAGFLKAHHLQFQNNKAVEALLALHENTDGTLENFQANLEHWYNDAMDRVSGWYKKYSQNVLLVIGLLLAIGFNVDTVQVARTLWLDRDARQDMVNAATAYLNKQTQALPPAQGARPAPAVSTAAPASASSADAPSSGLVTTPAAAASTATPASPGALPPVVNRAALEKNMRDSVEAFENVSTEKLLPMGWNGGWEAVRKREFYSWKRTLGTVAGWILTAVALSMGAPFWFDTLNKFMVVRSTIKPQEKSQPEASKD